MNTLSNIFFGTPQSKYAAIAIFITIALLCFFIIFSSSDISIEQRLIVVFFILLSSIPSILFALFELTCISIRNSPTAKWCDYLAWFITVIIVIYCVLIMIGILMSMSNYNIANERLNNNKEEKISSEEANSIAKNIMNEEKVKNSSKNIEYMEQNISPMPQQSKDFVPENKPSMQQMEQAHLYKASNQPYAEAAGYDSSDIYVSIKDNDAFVPQVPKMVSAPKIEMMQSDAIPEAFEIDPSLSEY